MARMMRIVHNMLWEYPADRPANLAMRSAMTDRRFTGIPGPLCTCSASPHRKCVELPYGDQPSLQAVRRTATASSSRRSRARLSSAERAARCRRRRFSSCRDARSGRPTRQRAECSRDERDQPNLRVARWCDSVVVILIAVARLWARFVEIIDFVAPDVVGPLWFSPVPFDRRLRSSHLWVRLEPEQEPVSVLHNELVAPIASPALGAGRSLSRIESEHEISVPNDGEIEPPCWTISARPTGPSPWSSRRVVEARTIGCCSLPPQVMRQMQATLPRR